MAVSEAKLGFGVSLRRGDGASPEVFTAIAEITDLPELGETKELVQVTHHESPGRIHEYINGLSDGEEFTVQMNWIGHATQDESTGIIKAFKDDAIDNYQVVGPGPGGAVTLEMRMLVLGWKLLFPLSSQKVLSATFKIVGEITATTSA